MQNHMRAQWVCSRERRIALYKRSSIYLFLDSTEQYIDIYLSIYPSTADHTFFPHGLNQRESAELWNTNSEAKLLVCLEEVKTNMIRIKNLWLYVPLIL